MRSAPIGGPGDVRLAICSAGELWGGVEQCILTLATGLRDLGPAPLVILFHEGLLAERLRQNGVTVEVLSAYAKYDPRAIRRIAALLRRDRISVLHVHGYKATVVGALAARRCGVRVVKTEHGLLEAPSSWRDALMHVRLTLNTALDRMASRCLVDAQVFVSRDLRARAAVRRPAVAKRLIYNGIEPPDAAVTSPAPRTAQRFEVGIVGRLTRVKGHEELLEAFARLGHLRDIRLHIFGAGPLEAACRRRCEASGLQDRVEFHGFSDRMRDRLAELDLLVMPSRHEGLPYVLLEAMALRVPIVASRVGGLQEVLEGHDCALLVPARDPAQLAAAIERLYHDAGLRRRLAANASSLVRTKFAAASMVEQHVALYRELVGSA